MEPTHEKDQTTIGVLPEDILTPEVDLETAEVTPEVHNEIVQSWYKNKTILASIGAAIILLGSAGFYAYTMYVTGGTVAVVNGKKIYTKEYNESVALITKNALMQGADITATSTQKDINDQALEVLINNALLMTAAEEAGFTATDEDVQKKYEELVVKIGGVEKLTEEMTKVGLTDEKLRKNIAERILSDLYIESETTIKEVAASDTEISEFYKALNTGGQKLPPLEEIRSDIEKQIIGEKQQQIITNLITKLREEGTIVNNI